MLTIKTSNFPPRTDFLVKVPTGDPKRPFFYMSGRTGDDGQCAIDVGSEEDLKLLELAQARGTLHAEFGQQPRKVEMMFEWGSQDPVLLYKPDKDLPETESWIDHDRGALMVKIRRWINPDKMPKSGPTKIGAIFSIDEDLVKLSAEPVSPAHQYPIVEMIPELPDGVNDRRFVKRLTDMAAKVGRDLTELQMFIEAVHKELGLGLKTPDLYKMRDELHEE